MAVTSPAVAGGALGARTNINQSKRLILANDERERALTLLRELGHAFNLLSVRGSGGSAIEQFDRIPSLQDRNETCLRINCAVVNALP